MYVQCPLAEQCNLSFCVYKGCIQPQNLVEIAPILEPVRAEENVHWRCMVIVDRLYIYMVCVIFRVKVK